MTRTTLSAFVALQLHSLFTILILTGGASADVRLPAHFSDHVVLQRDKPLPVWGWAEAGGGG